MAGATRSSNIPRFIVTDAKASTCYCHPTRDVLERSGQILFKIPTVRPCKLRTASVKPPTVPQSAQKQDKKSPPRHLQWAQTAPLPAKMTKKMSPPENEPDTPAKNCHRMATPGPTKAGKTATVSRPPNGRPDDQHTPTIEDPHRKLHSIRGDVHQLDTLDTSGNHPPPATRRPSTLTGDVFILVFSPDNRDPLREAQRLKQQIPETKSCLVKFVFRRSTDRACIHV